MSDGQAAGAGIQARIAGAPISWGVCEVPGWGYQLEPDQVLAQMSALGLAATEFGPDGFLRRGPAAKADQLAAYGMQAVGGFLPVLLHDRDHDPLPEVDAFIDGCLAAGAGVVVLAAYTGVDGYDARPVLDDDGWRSPARQPRPDRCPGRRARRRRRLHPHVGTMVEQAEEVDRRARRLARRTVRRHRAPGGRWCRPGDVTWQHVDRVRTCTSRTSTLPQADQVVDGELPFRRSAKP